MSVDPLLARLDYELVQMLRSIGTDGASFREIGDQFNMDERTVSRRLLEFDRHFKATQGAHILEREPRRRGYRLTATGRVFADNLKPVAQMMRQAVDTAAAHTRRVPVVCTSNCLHYWQRLKRALPDSYGFDIVPLPRRTAEIDLTTIGPNPEAQVGLLSALMITDRQPQIGTVTLWNDRIEVLPIEIHSFQLLTTEDLGLDEPVDVREAVNGGVTFLTPSGGVVWDFLARSYPQWHRLRPFQHVPVPDLEYGLKCLAARAVPRAAMVVHGFDPRTRNIPGLEDVRMYDFSVNTEHLMLAVTGVFHLRQDSNESGPSNHPQDMVWETAKRVWAEKERIL